MADSSRFSRLNSYLQQDPGNAGLLQDAFAAACAESLWDQAQALLQQAQALGHAPRQWALHRAHLAMARQRWPEALALLGELQQDPLLDDPARLVLATDVAQIHLRQGRVAEGLAALEALIEALPPDALLDAMVEEAWLRLLHRAGRLDAALEWGQLREQARTLSPTGAGVLSLVALDAAQFDHSLRWADQALAAQPAQLEAGLARASLALAGSDPAEALQRCERLAAGRENDGRVLSTLGAARLLNQDLPGARSAYEQACRLMPEHIGTWHGLAWTALLQGDLAMAEATFRHALSLDRNFADSHGGLGVALVAAGRRAEAAEAIRRALGLDVRSVAGHYAQLLLDDPEVDRTRLLALAKRLFGSQATPDGESIVALLAKRTGGP
ncbi:tetratricopeptide repeat protein [Roseateles toxinivorans]|uniref:Protein kinase G-like protein n=1 Tax=Roseateles toxinivorans TaxID=270368 RepID=A0A4R6QHB4_9BURK|nr:tetratricopeptide repeat protein [Roseateles toxinivorans]TDP61386.1 protein kinase G-like protein [Roseateles toxinivorans]